MVSKLTRMTITMYGADWCGDCRRAEKFFVDNKIDFQKIDLELDENEHFVESGVY
jgi:glutaredoxin